MNRNGEFDVRLNQSSGNTSELHVEDNCEETDAVRDLRDEIIRLPFDNTFKKVNSEFDKKLESIRNRIHVS